MHYDLRTYDLRPHALGEAERRLAGACAEAAADGDLVASLHTEIGPLNRVLQLWRYGDAADRERVEHRAAEAGQAIASHVMADAAERLVPFPCSPVAGPADVGPFFEVRRYRFASGELPRIVAAWEVALPARLELGPIVLVARTEDRESMVHIWPYRSLDERWRLRRRVRADGIWPPPLVAARLGLPGFELLEQESAIAVAASFSPLR